jgi:hypothetical protein
METTRTKLPLLATVKPGTKPFISISCVMFERVRVSAVRAVMASGAF